MVYIKDSNKERKVQLGTNIVKFRKAQNLTREQLSKKAKVIYRSLENIEKGETENPGIKVVHKIAKALGVSLDALVEGKAGKKISVPAEIRTVLSKEKTLYLLNLLKEAEIDELKKLLNFLVSIARETQATKK